MKQEVGDLHLTSIAGLLMAKTVEMMDGKRLTYADLIADNGLENGARS